MNGMRPGCPRGVSSRADHDVQTTSARPDYGLTRVELLEIGRGLELEVSTPNAPGRADRRCRGQLAGHLRAHSADAVARHAEVDLLRSRRAGGAGVTDQQRSKTGLVGHDERPAPKGKKGAQTGAEAPFTL